MAHMAGASDLGRFLRLRQWGCRKHDGTRELTGFGLTAGPSNNAVPARPVSTTAAALRRWLAARTVLRSRCPPGLEARRSRAG